MLLIFCIQKNSVCACVRLIIIKLLKLNIARTTCLHAHDLSRMRFYDTEAYFEAYRHVLKTLQGIDHLPFYNHIVKAETEVEPPRYLTRNTGNMGYDFSSLIKDQRVTRRCTAVNVLETRTWPTKEHLDVDESQYAAMQTAVTKRFALVQGPPGTGKTHCGSLC